MTVLANHDLLVFDQSLHKAKPREEDVQVVRNSSFDVQHTETTDPKLKDNYEYLERKIQFSRMKNQIEKQNQAIRNKFSKKDFSFGKLNMPATQQIKSGPIVIGIQNSSQTGSRMTSKSIFD